MSTNRFQLVGALLRPKNLLDYKDQIQGRDDITYPFYEDFEGYQEIETKEAKDIIAKQIAENIDVITDGEFTRSRWHLDFLWGFDGVERYIADKGYQFKDHDGSSFETRKDIGVKITRPISGKNHHFNELFKQTKNEAGNHEVKLTIWGPAHAFTELTVFNQTSGIGDVYQNADELKVGLINAYKEFLEEYAQAGGTIIQLDDCLWELFSEDNEQGFVAAGVENVEQLADDFIAINNEIADYAHELGLKAWTHNCRGNYESRHMAGGSYESIAEKFLKDQHYDRFFLEWDDERAGDLEALKVLQDKSDVEVVLGLLSSKTSDLDNEKRVYDLLEKASEIIPKDRLFLSHQCGFASCDCGNELSAEQQWEKVAQGQAIAKTFWND